VGAEAASGRLLWFLDADVRLAAEASASLLALHDEVGGLVSVQPYHDAAGGAEQLSAVFNAVAVLGSGELSPLGPPPAHRRAAFGPCLLVDRRTHLTLGGHGAVRDEIVEDMALARHHAAAGQPVTCRLGGDLVRFRMYPDGAQAMADGWTKNIAVGAGAAHPPAALLTAGWVAASAYVAAATTTSLVRPGRGPHRWAAAIGWLVVASTLHAVLRPIGAFRPWVAALFPLPFAWFVGVFARASVLTARGAPVRWKGRAIPAGRRATTSRREGPCCR
jgi:4,4'-diaponeurosporenoate glycosyltransferase